MNKPHISIIIPAYNEQDYIGQCLQALVAQLDPKDEIIVVDNNSSDNTVSIAKTFPQTRVIHEIQQGQVYAQATGFTAARNLVLARIDADTVVSSTWLSQLRQLFKDGAQAVTGPGKGYDLLFSRLATSLFEISFLTIRLVIGGWPLWGSNFAIHKELWNKYGTEITPRIDIWEDMEFGLILKQHAIPVQYVRSLRVGFSARSAINLTFMQAVAYQLQAPRTFYNRRLYVKAFFSGCERIVAVIVALPFLPFEYLYARLR